MWSQLWCNAGVQSCSDPMITITTIQQITLCSNLRENYLNYCTTVRTWALLESPEFANWKIQPESYFTKLDITLHNWNVTGTTHLWFAHWRVQNEIYEFVKCQIDVKMALKKIVYNWKIEIRSWISQNWINLNHLM